MGITAVLSMPKLAAAALLVMLCATTPSARADDIQPQQLTIPTADHPVAVTLFAAPGSGKRPAVLILHGVDGVTAHSLPHFSRYATALAAQGIDAYIVAYYSRADVTAMDSMEHGMRARIFGTRLGPWAQLVSEVVTNVLARPEATGKIGLLGLSNGAFLSVTESSLDPRITALVVLYGGIPQAMKGRINHLPPLLELHGDADAVIPLGEGNALIARAKTLDVPAQQVVYPGEGHGFDADLDTPDSRDAVSRSVGFLAQTLK